MIETTLFDIIIFIAFFSLSADVILQIMQVCKEKDSREISLKGELIRLFAVSVFLIRFIVIKDYILAIGQTIFILVFITYLFIIAKYRRPTRNYKKKSASTK